MRNEANIEIFHQAFSSRIDIVSALAEVLKPSSRDCERLKMSSLALEAIISDLYQCDVSDQYRAYQTAIAIFVLLAEWKHAIRNAIPDAQRFLSAAKLKVAEIDTSECFFSDDRLTLFLSKVDTVKNLDDLTSIHELLNSWTLPLPLFTRPRVHGYQEFFGSNKQENSEDIEHLETTVAFLKFDIDGAPAKQWNYLKPGTSYDLTIEVRVSNWPKGANTLLVTPITIDTRERDWLPKFRFQKPIGEGPYTLTGTGRAVLEVAHSFGSRPYEFLYAAEFDDTSSRRDVAIIGHRRLVLEGSDVTANPLSGFTHVDRHLIRIRDTLRSFPGLDPSDLANTMILLAGLGNIAAQALKSGLFDAGMSELQFQKKVSEILRSRPDIAQYLEGHPEAAGGITDLTFRDIPIELKVEKDKVLYPKDFLKFFDQTAAYAIALGKRIGVLCVLDASPKAAPVGVFDEDIGIFRHSVGQSDVAIVVIVVRGGFPKPSKYSK